MVMDTKEVMLEAVTLSECAFWHAIGSSCGRKDAQCTGAPSGVRRMAKNSVMMTGSTGMSTAKPRMDSTRNGRMRQAPVDHSAPSSDGSASASARPSPPPSSPAPPPGWSLRTPAETSRAPASPACRDSTRDSPRSSPGARSSDDILVRWGQQPRRGRLVWASGPGSRAVEGGDVCWPAPYMHALVCLRIFAARGALVIATIRQCSVSGTGTGGGVAVGTGCSAGAAAASATFTMRHQGRCIILVPEVHIYDNHGTSPSFSRHEMG
mmetsp:Transcript_42432/g.108563  ORF Transcript_42432/g.108563 Transcript_42432/m.108563 type:complete len:266 (-) Transcript_42432:779-1576(-)